MKKLILPRIIVRDMPEKMSQKEFKEMYENSHYEFVPDFKFDVQGLYVTADIDVSSEGDYIYAYIHIDATNYCDYYDYAIVKTDDVYFRTYNQWKQAVKTVEKQLCARWKEWVDRLHR